MNNQLNLIYEGKAKKIFSHEDSEKVIIEFKDDATAFNALKKAKFKGKGELNCLITTKIFQFLSKNGIPTHFIGLRNNNSIIAQKIKIFPLEIVLRNKAYGSICKQTTIEPGTQFKKPLIDIYFKNDELNDPLLTKNRIRLLNIISSEDLEIIEKSTLSVNKILKEFFLNINLELVDFKLEFGKNSNGDIVLADEFSPDNCRLWDLNPVDVKMRSLDKDRFRNDLGGLIEAYDEINNRIDKFFISQ
ncbi:MAG: phosphoribosylaminoimidazolesuccinocarboxamide synthase [Prochlorococcus marinus CUG1435]|nr:phosphoribosylaminoimidazolesuccinocarboxamide synthase [Prochlorococcus marinus CUG1435]